MKSRASRPCIPLSIRPSVRLCGSPSPIKAYLWPSAAALMCTRACRRHPLQSLGGLLKSATSRRIAVQTLLLITMRHIELKCSLALLEISLAAKQKKNITLPLLEPAGKLDSPQASKRARLEALSSESTALCLYCMRRCSRMYTNVASTAANEPFCFLFIWHVFQFLCKPPEGCSFVITVL